LEEENEKLRTAMKRQDHQIRVEIEKVKVVMQEETVVAVQ